ncbi:DNA polymerase IV [Ureaplasma urealyticum]|uniref:DNA polymerase IV n=2 Tax=Ureaplasma urealyticum TaxID=2130 RepID=A0AAP9AAB4_UREUR|nr:DNA polymerase IV [Ureaplasma urealyticum]EDX53760.1 ImpB/MucB/SamB family protein [Ureaplasma urealyticum serovar 9 str. ATCC 33175]EDU06270.1 DNA polymerase family protein [Ureaplasma urealyticum serovar 5 str. ATCC 27817]EDU57227.1 DNA polymerase family protein [Ureaplasma urealyticum serovar 7 str. ATCC 27819]EDU67385.1 DNA polymerase family protein [Ureaplasma urealyticum serovar 11 str. ATCC 33695]EDX53261.1 DNA polymerase family protein [Ureaplasma urealyticum serovar 12 str. ATCC 33
MQSSCQKIIMHLDIDAFYATVSELLHPEYKNFPIAVGSLNSRTGIISSPNYLARSYGVKSAMPIFLAKELCPNLIILPCEHDIYQTYSNHFFQIVNKYCNKVEITSIDECFIDATNSIKKYHNNVRLLAAKIQNEVKNKLNLSISVGISFNKTIAKMATELNKPFGISIIDENKITNLIHELDISKIPFIGEIKSQELYAINIFKIKELIASNNKQKASLVLGSMYQNLVNDLKGLNEIKTIEDDIYKSISHSKTFNEDLNDFYEISNELNELISNVVNRLKKHNLMTNNISINIKYPNFQTKVKQKRLDYYTDDYQTIFLAIKNLFKKVYKDELVRLIGVSLNKLVPKESVKKQLFLFD